MVVSLRVVNRQRAMHVDIDDSKPQTQPLPLLEGLLAVRWQDIPNLLVSNDLNQTTRISVAYEVSVQSVAKQCVHRLHMVSAALALVEDVSTSHHSSLCPIRPSIARVFDFFGWMGVVAMFKRPLPSP